MGSCSAESQKLSAIYIYIYVCVCVCVCACVCSDIQRSVLNISRIFSSVTFYCLQVPLHQHHLVLLRLACYEQQLLQSVHLWHLQCKCSRGSSIYLTHVVGLIKPHIQVSVNYSSIYNRVAFLIKFLLTIFK